MRPSRKHDRVIQPRQGWKQKILSSTWRKEATSMKLAFHIGPTDRNSEVSN
jgi:hypothetical protein